MTRAALAALLVVSLTFGCGPPDVPESEAPPASAPAVAVEPLPDSAFRVEWGIPGVPAAVARGSTFAVGVRVTNKGDRTWTDAGHTDPKSYGAGAVRLAARWARKGEEQLPPRGAGYAAERGELVAPVHPGQSAVLALAVTAPAAPGEYVLQLDLCQELVSWFEDKGSPVLRVPVTVR
jgi:hypothetical protein